MTAYIHHIPGRLRFRLAEIKQQPVRAEQVRQAISRIEGVALVDVNPLTGSVLVLFDAAAVGVESISTVLRGINMRHALTGPTATAPSRLTPVADKIVEAALTTFVERTAVALVVALF